MKVAIFTDTFTPQINGVTNTLNNVLKEYKKNNIQYLIFSPQYSTSKVKELFVERSFSLRLPLYPECRLSIPNTAEVERKLLAFNPDVIQLMTEFNMGVIGLKIGRKFNFPIISSYTTNFSQYSKYYNLKFFEKYLWDYLKWFHNNCDLTVCPTEEIRNILYDNGFRNVEIFSRGVDTTLFTPKYRSSEFRNNYNLVNKISFLYVGRISIEKDIDILLKCFEKLQKNIVVI